MFRTPNNKINLKKGRPILNISDSFRPVVWINGIMGLGMIEMPYGQPWPKLSIFYGFFRAIAFSVLVWYTLANKPPSAGHVSPVVSILYEITDIIRVAAVAVSSVMGLMNHEKSKEFFKKVKLVDETLKMFGIEPEYTSALRKNRKLIVNYCLAVIVTFVMFLIVSIHSSSAVAILRVLLFIIPMIINPIVDVNYRAKIYVLGKRFERLNALIHNVTTSPSKMMHANNFKKYEMILNNRGVVSVIPNYCFKNRNNIEFLLKVARQLHLELCNIARNMNDLTYNEISVQICSSFVSLTTSCYSFYFIVYKKDSPVQTKIIDCILVIFFIIFSMVRIILITYTTVRVTNEAGKIGKILHEIQIQHTEEKLTNEIHQFCMQLKQHPLSFTACGFIELNFSYVSGFVGSVTTYLMILIQNQSELSKVMKAANMIIDPVEANSTDITSA